MTEKRLTAKEAAFCEQYILDMNATKAAKRAGYSERTAAQIGYENLKKPHIQNRVQELIQARAERTKVDSDWVLRRLAEEATADVADLFDANGKLLPVQDWPPIWRQGLVSGIEVATIGGDADSDEAVEEELEGQPHGGALKRRKAPVAVLHKIKLSERIKRIELLGRHAGVSAFKDKVVHDVSDPLKKLLEQISGRAIAPAEEQPKPAEPAAEGGGFGAIVPKEAS